MSNPSNPSIAQSFKAGDKLAGCYTLKELLAPQGFCVVWLAHDEELGKDIVLHFVPDAVAADTRAMAELKQEAKRNRQLIHPRIIRVHDLVEDEKWAAITMDHVQGETLAVIQKKRDKSALNPAELASGISELCQTLEDAHRIDLFHRDLNPENLVATGNGLMVQKFGISRVILDSLARTGQPVPGSRDIAYISPQQLDAERINRTDDVYSLGATVYDLLTGAPPFSEGDILPQIRKNVPAPVSQRRAELGITGEPIPKAWDDAIAACLAKTPEERPKTAAEAGSRFAAGKIGGAPTVPIAAAAAAAAGAAAEAIEAKPPATLEQKPKEDLKAPSTPEPESAARQQKRPWSTGPGKTPVIAEATVLSKTAVPKGEAGKSESAKSDTPKTEDAGGPPKKPGSAGPTTPSGFPLRAFVELDGGAKPPKGKSHVGLIAAALVAVGVIGYIVASQKSETKNPAPDTSVATTGTNSAPAESPAAADTSSAAPSPVNIAANSTPAPADSSSPAPSASAPAAVAESPAPVAAVSASPVTGIEAMSEAQVTQLAADKAKAVDDAKAALATAEQAAKDKAAAQAKAAADAQETQAATKAKADAAAAAKKAADDVAATLKQQQEALQKAEAEASDAQKAAAAKADAAAQVRKTVQDAEAAAQQQQTAQQKAEADAAAAMQAAADRQKAADDLAKAAADAEKARAQQAQALAQAQADLGQVQATIQNIQSTAKARKAAEEEKARQAAEAEKARQAAEAEKARQAELARQAAEAQAAAQKQHEEETARLAAQAAAAAKAAADAEKALEAAKKAVADAEKAQAAAEQQAAAARNAASAPEASPAPSAEAPSATPAPSAMPGPSEATPAPTAVATPAPTATPAEAAATPMPAASPAAPASLTVHAPGPGMKVDQAMSNSLGMRFAPVGKVLFSIWLTRVQDFQAFANATGYKGDAWQQPGFKQGPDHPVVNVSWNDANLFCLWLTQKEHHDGILAVNEEYRLPTDLEWSKAVGLPDESGRTPESRDMDIPDVYPWGTQWPPPAGAGNYTGEETDSDVAIRGYNDGFAWTSPVGSFNANKAGLYDMGGNVWEWCSDWWNSEQKAKVLRGGSWYNGALKLSLLSSCRIHAAAEQGTDNYGFRVVIAQEMGKSPKKKTQ